MAIYVKGSEGRFYAETEHGEAELLYEIKKGIMRVYSTFVPEEERGSGIAEMLANAAFELAKEKGLRIRPDCSYMVHYIKKHRVEKRYVDADEGHAESCSI